jgi:hypothetical protein
MTDPDPDITERFFEASHATWWYTKFVHRSCPHEIRVERAFDHG